MQATLLAMEPLTADEQWQRAAQRECVQYGEHGQETETNANGLTVCFNCGGTL